MTEFGYIPHQSARIEIEHPSDMERLRIASRVLWKTALAHAWVQMVTKAWSQPHGSHEPGLLDSASHAALLCRMEART